MPTAASPSSAGRTVAFGPFSFDRTSRILSRDGVEVPLPPRVLGVLAVLLERHGDVVTKQELIAAVWPDAFVTETSLAEAVSVLRQTLGDDPQRPVYIQTLHRRGYRFVGGIREATAQPNRTAETTAARVPAPRTTPHDPQLSVIFAWTVALLAVLTAASAVWKYLQRVEPSPRQPVRFTIALPDGLTVASSGSPVAVSSDGALVAVAACKGADCGIYLRPLSQTDPILVAGSEGGAAPFFAPDGRSLGFFANGRLYTLALSGGSPAAVAEAAEPLGATWLDDGRIVFARSSAEGLFLVANGRAEALTQPRHGEGGHRWPAAVPGRHDVVFTVDASRPYAAALSMRTRRWSRLLDDAAAARVPLPGYLVAQRGRELIAGAVDPGAASMTGLPVPVASFQSGSFAPQFAMSAEGTLAIGVAGTPDVHIVLDWAGELRRLVPAPPPPVSR